MDKKDGWATDWFYIQIGIKFLQKIKSLFLFATVCLAHVDRYSTLVFAGMTTYWAFNLGIRWYCRFGVCRSYPVSSSLYFDLVCCCCCFELSWVCVFVSKPVSDYPEVLL